MKIWPPALSSSLPSYYACNISLVVFMSLVIRQAVYQLLYFTRDSSSEGLQLKEVSSDMALDSSSDMDFIC